MRSLQTLSKMSIDIEQRNADQRAREKLASKKRKPNILEKEAIDILKEENDALQKELRALRLRVLTWDKKEMHWSREVRSATEDADVLLEVVSLFSRVITNEKREWRNVREEARKLLESKKIPPPAALGSSRNRKKTRRKAPKTTESS